jgi:DNA-binding response OmpR family regulator
MLVILDDRELVRGGVRARFDREGVATLAADLREFESWLGASAGHEVESVEGFLIGECMAREQMPRRIRLRSRAPVIAINDTTELQRTLDYFAAGFDDVVRVPLHPREVLARIGAILRRGSNHAGAVEVANMRIFFDGRDPEVDGEVFALPRRERRILEFLARKRGMRVSKSQIFNAIYGVLEDDVEENVVESHVSKLRKKLKYRLGFDPIDAKRYLGYVLNTQVPAAAGRSPAHGAPRAPALPRELVAA